MVQISLVKFWYVSGNKFSLPAYNWVYWLFSFSIFFCFSCCQSVTGLFTLEPLLEAPWDVPVGESSPQKLVLHFWGAFPWQTICNFSSPIWHSWQLLNVEATLQIGGNEMCCSHKYCRCLVTFTHSVTHAEHCAETVNFLWGLRVLTKIWIYDIQID